MQIMCLDLWVAFFQPSNDDDDDGGGNAAKIDVFFLINRAACDTLTI